MAERRPVPFRIKNWLIYKILDDAILLAASKYASGRLIDIGCGTKPYAKWMRSFVAEHVGVDHADCIHDTSGVDLEGSAYALPVAEATFDTALCTEVLEHLETPGLAIAECARVLKPGGIAIYTTPFIWHLHEEPRDFYRYTKYGLRFLFEQHGFEVIEITAICGFWATFGQEFVYYLWKFRKGGPLNPLWWLVPPAGLTVQAVAYALDALGGAREFTANYLIVGRKK